jgi:lipid A 3-O-deacylase
MKFVAALAALLIFAPAASAQIVDSVRLGVMEHNIRVIDPDNADKESGVNINGELRFASPAILDFLWSPHPFVMASVNTDGNTSFAGVGLEWDWEFADGWRLEPGLGYVVHDGDNESPFPQGSQESFEYSQRHVFLGSTDLFRTSLALTYDINERWGVQVLYEHLSHGQILGSGRNQGLDELGVRAVYRFQ